MCNVYLSLNDALILANIADPYEKQHYAAFHLDLHCLPENLFTQHTTDSKYRGLLKAKAHLKPLVISFAERHPSPPNYKK